MSSSLPPIDGSSQGWNAPHGNRDLPELFDEPQEFGTPQPSAGSVLNGQPAPGAPSQAPPYTGQLNSPYGASPGPVPYDPYTQPPYPVPSAPNPYGQAPVGYPGTGYSYGAAAYHGGPSRRNSGLAVAAMVLGIVAMIWLPIIAAIPAAICGHMALSQIRAAGQENLGGRGMAITGVVLGYLNIGIWVLITLVLFLPFFAAF